MNRTLEWIAIICTGLLFSWILVGIGGYTLFFQLCEHATTDIAYVERHPLTLVCQQIPAPSGITNYYPIRYSFANEAHGIARIGAWIEYPTFSLVALHLL